MKIVYDGKTLQIPFVENNESGGGGDTSSPLEVWKEKETRIGTWIDGKPLYRRLRIGYVKPSLLCTSVEPNSTNGSGLFLNTDLTSTFDENAYHIDQMCRMYGYYSIEGSRKYSLPSGEVYPYFNGVDIKFQGLKSTRANYYEVYLWLEYTKKTD